MTAGRFTTPIWESWLCPWAGDEPGGRTTFASWSIPGVSATIWTMATRDDLDYVDWPRRLDSHFHSPHLGGYPRCRVPPLDTALRDHTNLESLPDQQGEPPSTDIATTSTLVMVQGILGMTVSATAGAAAGNLTPRPAMASSTRLRFSTWPTYVRSLAATWVYT